MDRPGESSTRGFELRRCAWGLAVAWTAVVAASLVWNIAGVREGGLEQARIRARSAHDKDLMYRRWNTTHGGVYVPVTEETQPNAYLWSIPERDIVTPSGRRLTLMNPAYMTRHVLESAEKEYGIRGHITSLDPIRPENAPDPWEAEALRSFGRGETEVSSVEEMADGEYLRLMRPLVTEANCLGCHAAQGYEEGDIRGGISVSIPMESTRAVVGGHVRRLTAGHGLLWLLGVGGIVLGTRRLRHKEFQRSLAQEALRKAKDQLEDQKAHLEKTNDRLTELDRLKSLFIASMSHELRTPLNSIIGFTGILLQGASGEITEEQRKQLTMVKGSAAHLLALINDIIDVSKIEAGEVEPTIKEFDLSRALREVKESFDEAAAGKGLKLSLETPESLVIQSDERRTKQIVMNFVDNAVRFTDGGEVRIAVAERERGVVVSVSDTGIGISAKDMESLFGAFSQIRVEGKPLRGGTGLGLYLSRKMAAMLGGEIRVESECGRGSTFTLALPLRHREVST